MRKLFFAIMFVCLLNSGVFAELIATSGSGSMGEAFAALNTYAQNHFSVMDAHGYPAAEVATLNPPSNLSEICLNGNWSDKTGCNYVTRTDLSADLRYSYSLIVIDFGQEVELSQIQLHWGRLNSSTTAPNVSLYADATPADISGSSKDPFASMLGLGYAAWDASADPSWYTQDTGILSSTVKLQSLVIKVAGVANYVSIAPSEFEISGSVIPEPASFAILLAGGMVSGICTRRSPK